MKTEDDLIKQKTHSICFNFYFCTEQGPRYGLKGSFQQNQFCNSDLYLSREQKTKAPAFLFLKFIGIPWFSLTFLFSLKEIKRESTVLVWPIFNLNRDMEWRLSEIGSSQTACKFWMLFLYFSQPSKRYNAAINYQAISCPSPPKRIMYLFFWRWNPNS